MSPKCITCLVTTLLVAFGLHGSGAAHAVPPHNVALTADHSAPQPVHTDISFAAVTTSADPEHQLFKWALFDGKTWRMMQNWSTNPKFTWTPSAPGTYSVAVWARTQGHPARTRKHSEILRFTITAEAPAAASGALAHDTARTILASTAQTITTNPPVPTLSISAPTTASGVVSITVSASHAAAVRALDLTVDRTILKNASVNPLIVSWDSTKVANGAHTLRARAYGSSGNVIASTSTKVTTTNTTSPAPNTPAPTTTTPPPAQGTIIPIPTTSSPASTTSPSLNAAIPSLSQWAHNMITFGQAHCTVLASIANGAIDPALGSTYYDLIRVMYQIQNYTGDPSWGLCAAVGREIYRDRYVMPNNAGVPGYWNFTTGLRMDFEHTGDALSKNAAILLSTNAAYAADTTPLDYTVNINRSREVAYSILSYINAEALGAPPRTRRIDLVNQAYDHLNQWFITQVWQGQDMGFAPFMVAITAQALIRDWEQTHDARLIPALTMAADYLWAHALDPTGSSMVYELNPAAVTDGGYLNPAPDLNLIIAPMYAFLYWQTGNTKYRDEADTLFAGGVQRAALGDVNSPSLYAKQFNQNYWWSFDYIRWRTIAP